MKVKMLNCLVSRCGCSDWNKQNKGYNPELTLNAQDELNAAIQDIENNDYTIFDIKVTSSTITRHNNGGSDEVRLDYLIMYGDK